MFILGCPGRSKSRRRHPGVPGQQPPALRLCVPQGVYPKRTPHRAAPGGPSSPCLLSACSPAARRHQAPPPEQEADSSPAGAPTRRSGLHPPPQGGPASESGAGRRALPNPGSRPQSGGDFAGPSPRRGARVHWRPPPGPRPRSSGPARTSRSPSLLLRNGEPLSPVRPGPARRQGCGLFVVPGSPSHSGARSRGETAPPQSPPSAAVVSLFSECKTARLSASRHQFKVGLSGAEQLSVRHARLRGHAPQCMYT
ncbi:hypothetical protein NDU88_003359 [Pleurodeles waltl]|uniref:Uncharacterized protein n=1 Tax=Pleurodeles waltl TaxID=8319 RepID=A0AAV7MRF1_PLEWA|nr:hypothetical protein NDU88_003359 [Pleurodeles waltl]